MHSECIDISRKGKEISKSDKSKEIHLIYYVIQTSLVLVNYISSVLFFANMWTHNRTHSALQTSLVSLLAFGTLALSSVSFCFQVFGFIYLGLSLSSLLLYFDFLIFLCLIWLLTSDFLLLLYVQITFMLYFGRYIIFHTIS